MNTMWQRFNNFMGQRNPRERVILLGATLILIVYAWGMVLFNPMYNTNADLTVRIADVRATVMTQNNRIAELNALLRGDPDSPQRLRQRELQQANVTADLRLEQLYSQLIDPRQMATTLAGILQRETPLKLVSLENVRPELIHGTPPAPGANTTPASGTVSLYKHGLRMVFEGSFMDTVRYLRSLEQLEHQFYWENIVFEIQQYPTARISLDIYTLSTQQEWIGV